MRTFRLVLLILLACLVATGLAPVTATAPPGTPVLVDIRASHHPGFDRIVYEFDGGLPSSQDVHYVDQLLGDGSGLKVRIAGRAILRVSFSDAQAHDAQGATVAGRVAFALPNIMTTVRSGDFEAVTTYGVGLAKKAAFQVSTLQNPSRVVIDIRAAFPTVQRKVFFFNRDNFVEQRGPLLHRQAATGPAGLAGHRRDGPPLRRTAGEREGRRAPAAPVACQGVRRPGHCERSGPGPADRRLQQ